MLSSSESGRPLLWAWLGRSAYRPVWELQEQLRERIISGDLEGERLIFVEHEPVITLGRFANERNILVALDELEHRAVELVRSSRGGDVTVHGPGQLVIYPVVRLTHGISKHVETVGMAITEELRTLGLKRAEWRRNPLGVWVDDAKIAACGVHVRHGVAIHGYALNVTLRALDHFRLIVPCGLAGMRVTSLAHELGTETPPLSELARSIAIIVCRSWRRMPVYSCDQMLSR